jgi:hypothetical protein
LFPPKFSATTRTTATYGCSVVVYTDGFHVLYALVGAAKHTEKLFVLIIFNQLHFSCGFFKTTIVVVGTVGYLVG